MNLTSEFTPVEVLTEDRVGRMFELMREHYENVRRTEFERDLAEKDCVISLIDSATGALKGFTTLMAFEHECGGGRFQIVFSGDTIVHPDSWGSWELPKAFGRALISIRERRVDLPLYWMLISKGFRTYRFLPVFFKEFHPCHDRPTSPELQHLMDSLSQRKYPANYDRARGLIVFPDRCQKLRPDLGTVAEARVGSDPHIRYFLERNPGHSKGDELVCLARFGEDNLTPLIRRILFGRTVNQNRTRGG